MKLTDLRDWIKIAVDKLNITQDIEYNIGRFLATPDNKDSILIAIKQLGGTTRAPFLRYNRYKIHIISGQIFMKPVDGNGDDIDYSDDDPMNGFNRVSSSIPMTPILSTDGTWEEGEAIANAIEIASDKENPPLCASGIKLLSSKAGPLYLDDGRIYYTLDLEIII